MTLLTLVAIDEVRTYVREDAFEFIMQPNNNVLAQLTIACVLPPDASTLPEIDREHFIKRLYIKGKAENQLAHFMDSSVKLSTSLNDKRPSKALCAIYSIDSTGYLTERLTFADVLITPYTYAVFDALPHFETLKENIECFLEQDTPTWRMYQKRQQQPLVDESATSSSKLVYGMMNLFNVTCSAYALKRKIPTLVVTKKGDLSFEVHNWAKFSSPLRDARGFINMSNLVDSMNGKRIVYNEEFFKAHDIRFQTV